MLTKAQQDYIDEVVARAGKPSAAVQLQIDRIRAAKNQDELTEIFSKDANIVRPTNEAELLVAIMLEKQAEFDSSGKVEKYDYREAKWWREDAEKGDSESQYRLGISYEYGYGVPQDTTEAIKWYRKAAEQGNVDAQSGLSLMYLHGLGVAKNIDEGRKWCQLAANQGDEAAQEEWEKLKQRDEQQKQPLPSALLKKNQEPQSEQRGFFNLVKAVGIVVLIFFGAVALLSAIFNKKHTGQAIEYTIIYTTINGQYYEKEETAADLNSEYVTFSDGTRVSWTAVKTKKATIYPDELGIKTNSNQ